MAVVVLLAHQVVVEDKRVTITKKMPQLVLVVPLLLSITAQHLDYLHEELINAKYTKNH